MWQVLIHPLVFKEDFKKLNRSEQQTILKTVRKKLTKDPKAFGKALTGLLQGFWRLRVGDFRVIYSMVEEKVLVKVIVVGMRRNSEVYEEMIRRIPKILKF